MSLALSIWVAIGCAYWVLAFVMVVRTTRAIPLLAEVRPPDPAKWPTLSLIVPARDEAGTIRAAMEAKLAEQYPELEAVLVDDRSRDETGTMIDRIAAGDPRVKAIHIVDLPAGWLGKMNALQHGLEASSGQWLLFTDADVHFAPGTLARAIAHAEARGVDHVAVLPAFESGSFWTNVAVSVALRLIGQGTRAWAVEDPKSTAHIGVGAFNLVRRSALDKTPGLEWLRLEIADDVGLGLMLKQSGARTALLNGRGMVSVQWYATLAEYARGAARAGFAAIGGFSAVRMAAWCVGGFLLESAPFWALGLVGHPVLQAAGAATSVLALASAVTIARFLSMRTLPALLLPVGLVVQLVIGLRAAFLGASRGGIDWRDTFYPNAVLRPGRRVRLP